MICDVSDGFVNDFHLTLDLNAAIAANPFPQRPERFPYGKQSMEWILPNMAGPDPDSNSTIE